MEEKADRVEISKMDQQRRTSSRSEMEAEEEATSSAFTAAEMWSRLPPGLREETFGFLTLQHANRMCRVSSDWKSSLERLAWFNLGTVFLQWPADFEKRNQDSVLWKENPVLKEGTMKHLVVLEKSVKTVRGTLDKNEEHRNTAVYAHKVIALPHPLTTITFCGGKREFNSLYGLLKLSEKVQTIRLVAFKVKWNSFFVIDNSTFESWSVLVAQDCRILTRHTLLGLEADAAAEIQAMELNDHDEEFAYIPPWGQARYDRFERWMLAESTVNPTSLFWPFPEEQLEWLQTTLLTSQDTIHTAGPVLNWVVVRFNRFLTRIDRRKAIWTFKRGPLKKMGIIWPAESNREMDVIDCAFLARLLQITPGVPPPPCKIPRDF